MPLLLKKQFAPHSVVALWHIQEDIPYFQKRLQLFPEETKCIEHLGKRKLLEWYASRYVLKVIVNSSKPVRCLYDAFGKPYLEGLPVHISVSHSRQMTAAVCSAVPAGVDIQLLSPKIDRIKQKFLTAQELQFVSPSHATAHLTVLWGIKEALYKAFGKKGLNFRRDLEVIPFPYEDAGGGCSARLLKGTITEEFAFQYSRHEDYILVYGTKC